MFVDEFAFGHEGCIVIKMVPEAPFEMLICAAF